MYNLALAQICPRTADVKGNLDKMEHYVVEAGKENAKLVVFPEMALTGYGCSDRFFEVAENIPGPSTERLARLAKDTGAYIIWGMPEMGVPGVLYNSCALVGPDGYVGKWRKHTLPGHATDSGGPGSFPDTRFFRAGSESPVFDTKIGRIGMMVCYDTFFPEISRLLTLKGADLLVFVAGSPAFEREIFEPIVRVRAIENTVWTAFCNLAGVENNIAYWGGSFAVGPGNVEAKLPGQPILGKAPYDVEALTFAEIDYSLTSKMRPFFPVIRDLPDRLYEDLGQAARILG
ncbi:MAG: carbon-nitrogen hydrolase family protein [Firmicutes bacterium]|nr:carbon-nitrogen hydrolase family protein [Bacillota bacterium]